MGMAAILLFMSGHGSCMCGHGCNSKEKCKAWYMARLVVEDGQYRSHVNI